MKAKLYAFTQKAPWLQEDIGSNLQELAAYFARVSNPSNQMNHETSEKLLAYCARNSHWSIFEMVSLTMYVETTRDIGRQLLRHSFKVQEFSQRYKEVDAMDDEPFEIRDLRFQHPTNRQSSIDWDVNNPDDVELATQWFAKQKQIIHEAKLAYDWALANGIAKEQARVVLPEGNTMSRLYIQAPLRTYIHYCDLRSKTETQKEHRELAVAIADEVSRVFPYITQYNNKKEK